MAKQTEMLLRITHLADLCLRCGGAFFGVFPESRRDLQKFSIFEVGPLTSLRQKFALQIVTVNGAGRGAWEKIRVRALCSFDSPIDLVVASSRPGPYEYEKARVLNSIGIARKFVNHYFAAQGARGTLDLEHFPYLGRAGWSLRGRRLHNAASPHVAAVAQSPGIPAKSVAGADSAAVH